MKPAVRQLATISRAVLLVPVGIGFSLVALAAFVPRQDYSLGLEIFFRIVMVLFALFWMTMGILGWRNGKEGLIASPHNLVWCDNMFSIFPRTTELPWESIESAELAALDPYGLEEQGLLLFLRSGVATPRPLVTNPQWLPEMMRKAIGNRDATRVVILANGEWRWEPEAVRDYINARLEVGGPQR